MGSIAGEDTDWNIVATSWTVSAGRLADSVAVESPLSPIDDDAAGSAPKTPLLLRPPSPDRSPGEITISLGDMRCAKSMSEAPLEFIGTKFLTGMFLWRLILLLVGTLWMSLPKKDPKVRSIRMLVKTTGLK